MSFYIFCPIFHVSKTFCSVLDKKLLNEIFGYGVHVSRPVYFAAQDLLVDAEGVVVEEGRVAGQHLVHEDAQRPPVHRLVVALDQSGVSIWSRDLVSANPIPAHLGLDDLGRQVLRGAAQGPGAVSDLLGKTKICDLQVALLKSRL